MTTEFELLHSVRPETFGPTDDHTTHARTTLMTVIEKERHETATQDLHRPVQRRRQRPRGRLVAILAVALLGAGGVASATGLIPDDVRRALGITDSDHAPGLRADAGKAQMRASAATADGGTVQLWSAPTDGGGQCSYLRRLPAAARASGDGGATAGPGVGCSSAVGGSPTPSRDAGIEIQSESSTGPSTDSALYGRAPASAAKLVVTFKDGITASAKPELGWFVISVPFSLGGPALGPGLGGADNARKAPQSATAFSSSGRVVATLDLRLP